MLRSVGAVIGGFVAMAVIVMIGSAAIMSAFVPGGLAAMRNNPSAAPPPTRRYLVMNITLSLLAAIVGGWVTSRIAPRAIDRHLFALGALILVMGVMSGFTTSGPQQPGWYKVLIPLIGVAGVAISALLIPGAAY